ASTTATYTINIGPDTDGDGLPDAVETNTGTFASENDTGTDPKNPDSDGDGFNDGVEVAAGSNPHDADSTPEGNTSAPFNLSITPTRLPSGAIDRLIISFPTRNGRSYRIEESNDFRTWRTRESGINGNGETIQRSLPAAGRKMLLRASEE
ncbi:MAG: thrombospondin type 3 repeat-containing protein, partial [Verrucomicrobiales bacterium]|nr:thrombospondin type 3 repeat-containing protein [Verrucomicrobiales bacterium]